MLVSEVWCGRLTASTYYVETRKCLWKKWEVIFQPSTSPSYTWKIWQILRTCLKSWHQKIIYQKWTSGVCRTATGVSYSKKWCGHLISSRQRQSSCWTWISLAISWSNWKHGWPLYPSVFSTYFRKWKQEPSTRWSRKSLHMSKHMKSPRLTSMESWYERGGRKRNPSGSLERVTMDQTTLISRMWELRCHCPKEFSK